MATTAALVGGGALLGGTLGALGSEDAQTSGSEVSRDFRDFTPTEFVELREPLARLITDTLSGRGAGRGISGRELRRGRSRFAAPLTPAEEALLARVTAQNLVPNELEVGSKDLLARTIRGDFLRPQSNPFLAGAIDALRNRHESDTLPELRGLATRRGQRTQDSSPFANVIRKSERDLNDTIARVLFDNFQVERGRQQQATALAQNALSQELSRSLNALNAVALPRMVEQLGIDRALQQYNLRQDRILRAAAIAAGLAGPTLQNTGGESESSQSVNPFLGFLSGAASGANLGIGAAGVFL